MYVSKYVCIYIHTYLLIYIYIYIYICICICRYTYIQAARRDELIGGASQRADAKDKKAAAEYAKRKQAIVLEMLETMANQEAEASSEDEGIKITQRKTRTLKTQTRTQFETMANQGAEASSEDEGIHTRAHTHTHTHTNTRIGH